MGRALDGFCLGLLVDRVRCAAGCIPTRPPGAALVFGAGRLRQRGVLHVHRRSDMAGRSCNAQKLRYQLLLLLVFGISSHPASARSK